MHIVRYYGYLPKVSGTFRHRLPGSTSRKDYSWKEKVATRRSSNRFKDTSLWPRWVTAYLKVYRSGGSLRDEGRGNEVDVCKLRQPVIDVKWGV